MVLYQVANKKFNPIRRASSYPLWCKVGVECTSSLRVGRCNRSIKFEFNDKSLYTKKDSERRPSGVCQPILVFYLIVYLLQLQQYLYGKVEFIFAKNITFTILGNIIIIMVYVYIINSQVLLFSTCQSMPILTVEWCE